MTEIAPTYASVPARDGYQAAACVSWQDLQVDDVGTPFDTIGFTHRCVQVDGDLMGGALIVEGSLDGVTWHSLSDSLGTPLFIAPVGLHQVAQLTRFVRPRLEKASELNVTAVHPQATVTLYMLSASR